MVKFNMELQWKEHAVDLEAFCIWAKAQDANCCGTSADSKLTVHFTEEPSQEVKDAIDQKWEDMDDEEHEMCTSYQSNADRAAAKAAAKTAAIAALATASGLSQDQINALLL